MMWGFDEVEGWFYTKKWHYYQRCVGKVASYVENYFNFYRVHVVFRGQLGACDIEYRAETHQEAFEKAEEFLQKYKDAETREELWQDYWSPNNPNSYWRKEYKQDEA